jgi:hypothetical protein
LWTPPWGVDANDGAGNLASQLFICMENGLLKAIDAFRA